MLWSAAGQTESSAAVGRLMHCGKPSPVAATAPSELFSDEGQNTGFNRDLFKCNPGVHTQLLAGAMSSGCYIVNGEQSACGGHRKNDDINICGQTDGQSDYSC